jgi:hypothetical protein
MKPHGSGPDAGGFVYQLPYSRGSVCVVLEVMVFSPVWRHWVSGLQVGSFSTLSTGFVAIDLDAEFILNYR